MIGGFSLARLIEDAGEVLTDRDRLVVRLGLPRSVERSNGLLEGSRGFVVALFALVKTSE